MSKARIKMGFSGLSVSQFILRCNAIVEAIIAHPLVFVTPYPTILVLEAAITLLTVRESEMSNGGKATTLLRNQARVDLLERMRELSIYVASVAQGDIEIILKSKFDVVGQGEAVGQLPPPAVLKVTCDQVAIGELFASWSGVPPSTGFLLGISLMENGAPTTWVTVTPNRLNHKFQGLISGAQYAIRVATVSRAGTGAWGQYVLHRPQ